MHKEIAKAQDIIVETLYGVFDKAVLHGGTAIWRCYKGRRFSEDVDVYISKDIKKLNLLFKLLEKKGFFIEKKKIGENSVYSNLQINRTKVRFEAVFKKIKGSLTDYETIEGNFLTIYALTPEEIIKEKVSAYLNRLKIRDLYDLFFLMRYIENIYSVKDTLGVLVKKFKEPFDEKELNVLIYEGLIPSSGDMLSYIQKRIKNGQRKIS